MLKNTKELQRYSTTIIVPRINLDIMVLTLSESCKTFELFTKFFKKSFRKDLVYAIESSRRLYMYSTILHWARVLCLLACSFKLAIILNALSLLGSKVGKKLLFRLNV